MEIGIWRRAAVERSNCLLDVEPATQKGIAALGGLQASLEQGRGHALLVKAKLPLDPKVGAAFPNPGTGAKVDCDLRLHTLIGGGTR